ncbi:MAG: molybdenum cofactor biosynthesis protein B [Myxococcota bacterium]|jgi:molybdenum cofactor biosynthesis protein B
MPGLDHSRAFVALRIAVLTVSDTRTEADDRSGPLLAQRAEAAGHVVVHRAIIADERPTIEAELRRCVAGGDLDVVITTGGTGITGRDVTPEAVHAIIDKHIPGFGEYFRWISISSVGTSTIQSRATAGVAGRCLVFALPGSTGACRDAWDQILIHQLDSRHRPCNFAELLPRLEE